MNTQEDSSGANGQKRFLYVNRRAPYGTIYALAFDQDVSLAFLDDGVYQIVKGQDTEGIGMKNFSPTYRALGDFEVTKLFVERESLEERGLSSDDLLDITYEDEDDDWAEKPSIRIVSRSQMTEVMAAQDVILSF